MIKLRHERISSFIKEQEIVTIKQLQELCPEVSLMTIHRDLDALASAGELVKLRGGARTIIHSSDPAIVIREQENLAEKALIAQKALKFIHPNSSIFLDAGTTSMALAKIIPDIPLSIFTTGPNIAIELSRLAKPSIALCGGDLNKDNLTVSGYSTLEFLKNINIDLAFIGVSGCSVDNGLTCGKESEMMVKQLVINKARTSIVLCDYSKLTMLMPFTFAGIKDVDYIISDKSFPEAFLTEAKKWDTEII